MITTNHHSFGAISPEQIGISAASKLINFATAPIVAAQLGTSVLVGSTLIGIPLAIAGLVYSLFASKKAKKQAEERAQRAYIAALIKAVKEFMAKIGYRENLLEFDQEFAGSFLDIWNRYMQTKSEGDRKAIVDLLRNNGFDPTRFVGGDNVRAGEKLSPEQANNAEKHLTTRDFLISIGYPVSIISTVSGNFGIGVYNEIVAFGKVTTEDEALGIKIQLEDLFIDEGINPFQLYKVAIYGEAYWPYTTTQVTQAQIIYGAQPEDILIDQGISPLSEYLQGEGISKASLFPSLSLASMPVWGWVLLAGGALSLLMTKR